jgi:hypothetical protein
MLGDTSIFRCGILFVLLECSNKLAMELCARIPSNYSPQKESSQNEQLFSSLVQVRKFPQTSIHLPSTSDLDCKDHFEVSECTIKLVEMYSTFGSTHFTLWHFHVPYEIPFSIIKLHACKAYYICVSFTITLILTYFTCNTTCGMIRNLVTDRLL